MELLRVFQWVNYPDGISLPQVMESGKLKVFPAYSTLEDIISFTPAEDCWVHPVTGTITHPAREYNEQLERILALLRKLTNEKDPAEQFEESMKSIAETIGVPAKTARGAAAREYYQGKLDKKIPRASLNKNNFGKELNVTGRKRTVKAR